VSYYAKNKVVWEIGSTINTYRGGFNKVGVQSKIDVSSIVSITGRVLGDSFYSRQTIYADRDVLYARDRFLCAYCGSVFSYEFLTIDHVLPKSRGGKNTWVNCVTACKSCNHKKKNRTPEEAKMHLIYVPYAPTLHEKIFLKGKKILTDQMEYLLASIPKTSRVWN
jgi:hypothetical protein